MPMRILQENEIGLDEKIYRTAGPVSQFLVSRQIEKVTSEDYTDTSNPMASEYSQDDFRDGIGVEIGDPRADLNRAWWGEVQLRYKGRIINPRRVVQTAAGPATEIDVLIDFKNEEYATYGTAVHLYDDPGDSWGSSIRTLLNSATDAAVGLIGGTETLAIATGSEVDYATDSATWARNTTDIKYVIFWNDLLWGISQSGQLFYTDDLTTAWTADAQLQLPDNYVTGLHIARGPDREEHVYAATKVGLFVHASTTAKFVQTDLSDLPFHPDAGKGHEVWRGFSFLSAGLGIYAFQAGSDQTIVTIIGPDRDHGVPANKRGVIKKLIGTHNDLLALVDASATTGVSTLKTRASRGARFHHGVTFGGAGGFSHILGWDQRGWESKWVSSSTARPITTANVSNAYNTYRLWFAVDQRVHFMSLPIDVVNPLQIPTQEYDPSGTLETFWNDLGIRNQRKLALSVIVETVNPTVNETVKIEYALDYDETYRTLATQNVTGETEYRLPDKDNVEGVEFRAWKFLITLTRGSTVTNTPQLVKLTLVYRPRVKTLYGVAVVIDATEDSPDGRPPVKQILDLRAVLNSTTLFEVTYRMDNTNNQNYWMDLVDIPRPEEKSGLNAQGLFPLVLGEPRQTKAR